MAEPVCSPRSRHDTRPLTFADAPAPPSAHELFARRMQDLPRLPSRAALLALTEHDLLNIDDLPTPDSILQDEVTYYTVLALKRALRHHPDTYAGGCTLVYDAGRPGEDGWISPVWIVPDPIVAFGVGSHRRSSYVMWREGKPPEFVMEYASVSTWRRDRDEKPARYESLGVSEYFLYDLVGGLLQPRLQGHVLNKGRYRTLRPERLPNGERGLRSEVLGLWAYPCRDHTRRCAGTTPRPGGTSKTTTRSTMPARPRRPLARPPKRNSPRPLPPARQPKRSSPSCGRKSGGCGASRGRSGAGYKFRISTGVNASAGSNPNTRA